MDHNKENEVPSDVAVHSNEPDASNEAGPSKELQTSKFRCQYPGCKKDFSLKTNMKRHMKTSHSGQVLKECKVYKCLKEWCSKTFPKKSNLDRHEKICSRPKKNKNQCFICKRDFSKSANLRRHLQVHTKPVKKKVLKLTKSTSKDALPQDSYISMVKDDAHKESVDSFTNETFVPAVYGEGCSIVEGYMGLFGLGINDLQDSIQQDDSIANISEYTKITEIKEKDPTLDFCVPHIDGDPRLENDRFQASNAANLSFEIDFVNVGNGNSLIESENCKTNNLPCDIESNIESKYATNMNNATNDDNDSDDSNMNNASDNDNDSNDSYMNEDEHYRHQVNKSFLSFLRYEIRNSRTISKKIATSKLLKRIFSSKLEDPKFVSWFSSEMLLRDVKAFENLMKYADVSAPIRGRPIKLSEAIARNIYFFWKENSIISVDRRNDRNVVKTSKAKINKHLRSINDDSAVKLVVDKKGREKLHGDRHIYIKAVRDLHKEFLLKHGDDVSLSLFFHLKPFYIGSPSVREMESCTCISCVNPHYLYKSLKQNIKKKCGLVLPESLTDYLSTHFECPVNNEFNYYELDCIKGKCESNCKIQLDPIEDDGKLYSYIEFKSVETIYYNKKGELVTYKRCARTEEKATLEDMQAKLSSIAQQYMTHRFYVTLDKVFWPVFKNQCPHPILHVDYSQNIQLTPKNEVQSAHFSGRQHTLHCSVLYKSAAKGDHEFIYHLSDDTNHDCIMTSSVLEDVLVRYPSIADSGILVVRSDNCSTQYKSRFVFGQLSCIAKKYSINIFWFYGAPGHGRGLVDAMSSFGCKSPMKYAIITEDKFFVNSQEMHDFLSDHFKEDLQKSYFVINEKMNSEKRKVPKEQQPQHVISGSSKLHCVAVSSDGQWLTRLSLMTTDQSIMQLRFDLDNDVVVVDEDEEDDDVADAVEEEDISAIVKYEFITKGSFVTLPSHSQGYEQFYLVEVMDKELARQNITDKHGHSIAAGEMYIEGAYFEIASENEKWVRYNKSKKFANVVIHINEISSVNVDFDGQRMSKEEYVSLCNDIF